MTHNLSLLLHQNKKQWKLTQSQWNYQLVYCVIPLYQSTHIYQINISLISIMTIQFPMLVNEYCVGVRWTNVLNTRWCLYKNQNVRKKSRKDDNFNNTIWNVKIARANNNSTLSPAVVCKLWIISQNIPLRYLKLP